MLQVLRYCSFMLNNVTLTLTHISLKWPTKFTNTHKNTKYENSPKWTNNYLFQKYLGTFMPLIHHKQC